MGRRAKDWYPNQFKDRRKQQEQRPIAAAPSSMDLANEYPAPTIAPPLSSSNPSMSTPLPSRSRGAGPGPPRGSRARSNRSNTNRTRPNENLCMRIRLRDQTEAVARVLVVDGLKNIGISEGFVTRNNIFFIPLPGRRQGYIAEGPASTGILHKESSADITILHPSKDPSKIEVNRAIVFRPESSRQPSHDIRVPRRMRYLCEPMIEDVLGHAFSTLSEPQDFNSLLEPQQHPPVGGDAYYSRLDRTQLGTSIHLPYLPEQHSLPYGGLGPTPAASDSFLTMPSYQPGLWDYGMQPISQQPRDDGQGNYGLQLMSQWPLDDGMQSTSQQPRDDGQGNYGLQLMNQMLPDDGMQSTSQQPCDDGQENYGMLSTSQLSWGPPSNM